MKITVEIDGETYLLDVSGNGSDVGYTLRGAHSASGSASIVQTMPGVFSVLLESRSFRVHLAPAVAQNGSALEVWAGTTKHVISIADPRDRGPKRSGSSDAGPVELRAQMPGKVVALLTKVGAEVHAGQGLIVVEAMKMQNEMKSPKNGVVVKTHVAEGATVAAGDPLITVE